MKGNHLQNLSVGKSYCPNQSFSYFMNVGEIVQNIVVLFSEFKQSRVPLLIATDVASRGLGLFRHPE